MPKRVISDSDDDLPLSLSIGRSLQCASDDSSDDDDVPLSQKFGFLSKLKKTASSSALSTLTPKKLIKSRGSNGTPSQAKNLDTELMENAAFLREKKLKSIAKSASSKKRPLESDSSDSDFKPVSVASKRKKKRPIVKKEGSDSDDDVPLSQMLSKTKPPVKNESKSSQVKKEEPPVHKWWEETEEGQKSEEKWTTLSHNGVVFPPAYVPHGVPLIYNGNRITLTPEQEEVASFYAAMSKTDYMEKKVFHKTFGWLSASFLDRNMRFARWKVVTFPSSQNILKNCVRRRSNAQRRKRRLKKQQKTQRLQNMVSL